MANERETAGTGRGASLRYEFARRATIRNLAAALVIAAVVCAGVLLAAIAWQRQQAAAARPGRNRAAGSAGDGQHFNLAGDKLIPSTPEMRRKAQEYLASQGVLEGFDAQAFQEQMHITISNVVYVESGKGWNHAIVIMPENKLHHVYDFTFSCGHTASVTPDPYRDLMFAQPDAVQSEYAAELCHDCKLLRRSLDQGAIHPPKGGK